MKIADFDKNLAVTSRVNRPGIKFYDIDDEPFRLYGIFQTEEDGYHRVPRKVAEAVSTNLETICAYTTGGRVRFTTDSPYVAVRVKLREPYSIPFMTFVATCGFDVYADNNFAGTMSPPLEVGAEYYDSLVNLGSRTERVITLNMPLYSNIDALQIGIDETSSLGRAPDYKYEKPIVYYGSSITNGAVCSRPGLTYEAIISRRFDINHVNLGFGGSARGEESMAKYIASLDMSIFVYDYDHNAPTVKHLEATHSALFDTVRAAHPKAPVIMISRPTAVRTEDTEARLAVIRATYERAVKSGDTNVYLIDGGEFFDGIGNDWSMDNVHPTDHGFRLMANKIGDVIGKILADGKADL